MVHSSFLPTQSGERAGNGGLFTTSPHFLSSFPHPQSSSYSLHYPRLISCHNLQYTLSFTRSCPSSMARRPSPVPSSTCLFLLPFPAITRSPTPTALHSSPIHGPAESTPCPLSHHVRSFILSEILSLSPRACFPVGPRCVTASRTQRKPLTCMNNRFPHSSNLRIQHVRHFTTFRTIGIAGT